METLADPYSLAGRVAVVTGAASGIGRSTASVLTRQGASVALVDIDEVANEQHAAALRHAGGTARSYHVDLADADSIDGTLRSISASFGNVDILVCSAGVTSGRGGVLGTPDEVWDRTVAVNLSSSVRLTRWAAGDMIERRAGGRIIYVSSSSAFRAVNAPAAYATTKAALVQLTRSAAAELGPHDINVNAVAPGLTRTAIIGDLAADVDRLVRDGPLANLLGRASEPEDVAEVIAFLCMPASRQITGQVIHTSAGAVV